MTAPNDSSALPTFKTVKFPIDKELAALRIPSDLSIVVDLFERDFSTASRPAGGTLYRTRETPRDALIGAEHTANAMLPCRFIASRLGHMYQVLVDAIIFGKKMDELALDSFPGQSGADASARGRSRLIDALLLAGAAYDEWIAIVGGTRPRLAYALGNLAPTVSAEVLAAANDNARYVGNAVHREALASVARYRATTA